MPDYELATESQSISPDDRLHQLQRYVLKLVTFKNLVLFNDWMLFLYTNFHLFCISIKDSEAVLDHLFTRGPRQLGLVHLGKIFCEKGEQFTLKTIVFLKNVYKKGPQTIGPRRPCVYKKVGSLTKKATRYKDQWLNASNNSENNFGGSWFQKKAV